VSSARSAGGLPFTATVLPLPGQLPQGQTLVSADDGALAASVVARWPDQSAAVVVVASSGSFAAGETRSLRLQAQAATGTGALDAGRIGQLLASVIVDAGSAGRIELRDFAQPERLWWANARTVCARYRSALVAAAWRLEVVVDVQAFDTAHAFVEVVVENGSMLSSAPAKPAAATYGAQVLINGQAVATVASSGAPEGQHVAFRAWYASGWIGGDPGLRATQAHTDLQAHPLLFKCDRAGGDMAAYANDGYVVWGSGRQRASVMGAGGDHPSIGPLPLWEAQFLQTGDPRAARAVEASALAVLGYNLNYRDSATGLVPTFEQLAGRSMQFNWPVSYGINDRMSWEVAHHPAAGLMAFVCRPSPVYIELAQKVAVWNGTWSTWGGTATGVFGRPYQGRGRAWCMRSLAHALLLTPDGLPWKAAARESLAANVSYLGSWRSDAKARLGAVWGETAAIPQDSAPNRPGFQEPLWFHHYLAAELHKIARAGLLSGAAQAELASLADWACLQPVRWINEQPNGSWRYVPYTYTLGRDAATLDSMATYGEQSAWAHSDTPPAVGGPWMSFGDYKADRYAQYTANPTAGAYYPSYLWAALVAAVERGVPGSAAAWSTVQSQLSNLNNWRDGFAADPRWGAAPRNT
jgi:hypothetical protein